jgi:hypothetical protein
MDDAKENVASKFLYNPFEYVLNGKNKDAVLSDMMKSFFQSDEKFGKFEDTLGVEWQPGTTDIFNKMPDSVKIMVDEYINKKFYDTLKKDATNLQTGIISVSNIDELKTRLKNMFTY